MQNNLKKSIKTTNAESTNKNLYYDSFNGNMKTSVFINRIRDSQTVNLKDYSEKVIDYYIDQETNERVKTVKFKAKSIEGNIMIRENNPSPDILEEILKQLKTISSDVSELKTDVAQLKTDMVEVKADIVELKTDVAQLKTDMVEVKADIVELKTDVSQLKKDVSRIMKCPTIVRELAEID
ncbi:hypothetical protein [Malacoplasma penetrans]|uniref:DUF16 domain-containing protein n=1 Tax=Malacoplasma penetrans (strain HF-2) TaxID=272633 RepID=Q8EW62_MALP2|nr:hypothetical protein [Malacoplasma penetrans]BAC44134.1 hypothetical protein [Malacoplasma penetrans HF-2]